MPLQQSQPEIIQTTDTFELQRSSDGTTLIVNLKTRQLYLDFAAFFKQRLKLFLQKTFAGETVLKIFQSRVYSKIVVTYQGLEIGEMITKTFRIKEGL